MKSLEELKAIRERMQGQVGLRSESATDTRVVVGMATCGIASGARPVLTALCQYEPIVEVLAPGKEKVTYVKMTAEKALEVVEKHLIRGQVISEYTIQNVMK